MPGCALDLQREGVSGRLAVCDWALGPHTQIHLSNGRHPAEPSFDARPCAEQLWSIFACLLYPATEHTLISPLYTRERGKTRKGAPCCWGSQTTVSRLVCVSLKEFFSPASVALKCFALGLLAKSLQGPLHWITKAKFNLKGKD